MADQSTSNQSTTAVGAISRQRTEQLYALGAALGGAITTSQVTEVIIQAALPIFEARMGLVALLSEDGTRLESERIVGVPTAEADLWRSFPAGARLPLADAVRERRLVVLLSNEAHDAAYPELAALRPVAGEGALVAVPLLIGERCIGGIGLICPPDRCSDEERQTFLWTLAGQCALALERSRLYDRERDARAEALADISERKAVETALRESETRFRALADNIAQLAWMADGGGSLFWYNKRWFDYTGMTLEEMRGSGWAAVHHPDFVEGVAERFLTHVRAGTAWEDTFPLRHKDGSFHWFLSRAFPVRDETGAVILWCGTNTDITEQRAALATSASVSRREAILNQIAQAVLRSFDAEEIQTLAVNALGEALNLDRCYFHFFDPSEDATWIESDWHRDDLPSVAGRYPLSLVQPTLLDDLFRHSASVRISDIRASFLQPETVALLEPSRYRALVTTPFYSQGELTAVLALIMVDTPREWTDEELSLVEAVAAQTPSVVEASRLLTEQQARLRRDALLGRVSVAIRSTLDPDQVQARAAALLGEALDADRCFYVTYDLERDHAQVSQDWHRADLTSLAGPYSASSFAAVLAEMFTAQATAVIRDVRTAFSPAVAEVFETSHHRALLVVPVFDEGEIVAALYVSQADAPRVWTADEVALVEQVATLTRTALEIARASQKEHNIAQQLQDALQPAVPEQVPGLVLAHYYRAALEEAGVGGDFTDVFAADKGITFLVVADLSGKGLAAASEVATVRNMLRFAVYNGQTLAGPITSLNRTLAEYDLLSGFATLFVGRYDAHERRFTYVNCGQDAGLILRAATGSIETLPPTGPVLGAVSEADFTEASVTLESGDVVALYSDGLTEAGPTRTALLTGAGVADLLRGLVGVRDPRNIVRCMMAGVDAHAGRGVKDDQCLLVGVVNGG